MTDKKRASGEEGSKRNRADSIVAEQLTVDSIVPNSSEYRVYPGGLTQSEYSKVHAWMKRNFERPEACDLCGEKANRYDWANLTGEYRYDRQDWANLCKPCHAAYDLRKTHCPFGHKYTEENSYYRGNRRDCRACGNKFSRNYYWKNKERLLEIGRAYKAERWKRIKADPVLYAEMRAKENRWRRLRRERDVT